MVGHKQSSCGFSQSIYILVLEEFWLPFNMVVVVVVDTYGFDISPSVIWYAISYKPPDKFYGNSSSPRNRNQYQNANNICDAHDTKSDVACMRHVSNIKQHHTYKR